MSFPKIAQFKSSAALRAHLAASNIDLPLDDEILTAKEGSPLAQPITIAGRTVGNRWCIHPMEGWDANADGSPSELTLRRWRHFGASGAKLIWGGEAAAVEPAGRANPRQTLGTPENRAGLAALLAAVTSTHRERHGTDEDLLVGLQLTHSGRFCRPHSSQLEPRIAYHHPLLDARFGIDLHDDSVVWTDDELGQLIDKFVQAAGAARDAGFAFVDVKACHGYLLHEFLSAYERTGPFGGDFAGRTRLLLTIIEQIRATYPDLAVVVRLSAFDTVPYEMPSRSNIEHTAPNHASARAPGQPMDFSRALPYRYGFGLDSDNPLRIDLTETIRLVRLLASSGVAAVNVSGGSPYYNPHIQRPASFPPSDGYQPPEDPLVGVARQIDVARQIKQAVPDLPIVGTGYSYLQDYLPHVAQAVVREQGADLVGLGRMVLSYPELPADVLSTGRLARKRICRTFSDCTTAPRNGIVSGCFPLDPRYKSMAEAATLQAIKSRA
jgi:2,4-dienoyl-CoA reductase-like NADH-dependent reductase (Old Yellow Enzyme family)